MPLLKTVRTRSNASHGDRLNNDRVIQCPSRAVAKTDNNIRLSSKGVDKGELEL